MSHVAEPSRIFNIFIYRSTNPRFTATMDKLLNWATAQQTGDKDAIEKIGQPDPKILNQLFGGPDEPTLMQQALIVIKNPESTLENKEIAFDNFEMLIENLDNANNIGNMKMWPTIAEQLDASVPTSLRVYAASVAGIAVQNNPTSQQNFIDQCDGLQKLIAIGKDPATPQELLLKTYFALASLLRNFSPAYAQFDSLNGWDVLSFSTQNSHKVKLRILSLLSAIFSTGLDTLKNEHVHSGKVVEYLVSILKDDSHTGCIDKALNIVGQLSTLKYNFTSTEIADLAQGLENIKSVHDSISHDDLKKVERIVS